MKRFEVEGLGDRGTVEIDGDTIRAHMHGWDNPDFGPYTVTIPPKLTEGAELRRVAREVGHPERAGGFDTLEEFASRPYVMLEIGEWEYLDDDGTVTDTEPAIKIYDVNHGGGVVWPMFTDDEAWGTARGRHASLPDGTILRDGTISQSAIADARRRIGGA